MRRGLIIYMCVVGGVVFLNRGCGYVLSGGCGHE